MPIAKTRGEPFGISSARVRHTGKARAISLLLSVVESQGIGHTDPMSARTDQRFWFTLQIPKGEEELLFKAIWESGLPQSMVLGMGYDVNVAVGELRGEEESEEDWYSRRSDDDWDENVYMVVG